MEAFRYILLLAVMMVLAACGNNIKNIENGARIEKDSNKLYLVNSQWVQESDGVGTKNWTQVPLGNADWVPVKKERGSFLAILGKNHRLIFRLKDGTTGTYHGDDIGFVGQEVVEFRMSDSHHEMSRVAFCEFQNVSEAAHCGMKQRITTGQLASL